MNLNADREAPIPKIKLSVPPVHPHHLHRPRLEALLRESMEIPGSTLLVSAPPGYGKSSLLAGWLMGSPIDHAWLTLDREDDDPSRFMDYLYHALEPHLPGDGESPRAALSHGHGTGSAETIAVSFSNSLAERAVPLLIVLDDFHVIESPGIYEIFEAFLKLQPPNMHLAILTREDPPLSLARLRAQGKLREIRMEELSFTADETSVLISRVVSMELDKAHIAMLQQKTEGWAAALQLALSSLSGRGEEGGARFVEQFSGNNRHIIDYLMDEVLRNQPAELISFLDETSQLDRFSPEVCDWVTEREDSGEILRRLERENLLLLTLDGDAGWFRYHNLFADFLRTRLPLSRRKAINERAAGWFQAEEMKGEALRHALRSEHPERYLPLLRDEAIRLLWAGRPGELLQLAAGFTPATIAVDPDLFELLGWGYYLHNQVAQLAEHLRPALEAESLGVGTEIIAALAGLTDLHGTIGPDERAVGLLAVLRSVGRSLLSGLLGNREESLLHAQTALAICRRGESSFLPTCVSYNYAVALLENGDAQGAALFLTREIGSTDLRTEKSEDNLLRLLRLPLAAVTVRLKRATGITPDDVETAMELYEKIDASHVLLNHGALLAFPYLRFHGREREAREMLLRFIQGVGKHPLLRKHQEELRRQIEAVDGRPGTYKTAELPDPLSKRERDVLRELVRGLSNAEIAEALYISTGTVKWHINRILTKLDAQSRTQAAARARELGLV